MNWVVIGRIEDLPRQGSRVVRSEHCDIAVFRTSDDRIFALRDACPHKGGALSQGIVHGHRVTCPLHNWKIELASGEAVAPDEGCAGRYPVRLEDGRISLCLQPEVEDA